MQGNLAGSFSPPSREFERRSRECCRETPFDPTATLLRVLICHLAVQHLRGGERRLVARPRRAPHGIARLALSEQRSGTTSSLFLQEIYSHQCLVCGSAIRIARLRHDTILLWRFCGCHSDNATQTLTALDPSAG